MSWLVKMTPEGLNSLLRFERPDATTLTRYNNGDAVARFFVRVVLIVVARKMCGLSCMIHRESLNPSGALFVHTFGKRLIIMMRSVFRG